ncbi:MAG: hypothetical protein U0800_09960 [Isosphaeraceae bacterium]
MLAATLAALLPMTVAWSESSPGTVETSQRSRSRMDAARLSGLQAKQARRLARTIAPRSIALPGWILAMAMAITTTSTILIPPATPAAPTLAAAIADGSDPPHDEAWPFLPAIAIAIALAGLTIASTSRPSRVGKLARQGFGPP